MGDGDNAASRAAALGDASHDGGAIHDDDLGPIRDGGRDRDDDHFSPI